MAAANHSDVSIRRILAGVAGNACGVAACGVALSEVASPRLDKSRYDSFSSSVELFQKSCAHPRKKDPK